MAPATSPTASPARFLGRAHVAWLAVAVLALAAPALADDPVYIWRDASGAVRFSPVRESAPRPDSQSTVRDADPQPAVSEPNAVPQPY